MEFVDNNKKYIIPFDSVDLSLLPSLNTSLKPGKEIVPLWSIDNLQKRQEESYFEFEIIERDATESDMDCSSLTDERPSETGTKENSGREKVTCHICNINVPAVCISEHVSSSKHRTFQKIAEISLDRVKRQMSVNYRLNCAPAGFTFCDNCVCLVPERDKNWHFASKPHRDAELLDRFAEDLLKIYSADVNTVDSNENKPPKRAKRPTSKESVADKTRSDANSQKEGTNVKSSEGNGEISNGNADNITPEQERVSNEMAEEKRKESSDEMGLLTSDTPNCKANGEVNNDNEDIDALAMRQKLNKRIANSLDTDLNDYLHELNSAKVAHKLNAVDKRHIVIETKGRRMRVELENFHGLIPWGKRHVQCSLCKKIERDVKGHIYSQNHLNNLRRPIDGNCIRELDDGEGHCVLCNCILENIGEHTLCCKEHEMLFNKSLMADESPDTQKQLSKSKPTITETEQVKTIKTDYENKSIAEVRAEERTSNLHHEKNSPVKVLCNICFTSVDAKNYESHCELPMHKSVDALKSHHLLEYFPAYNTLRCKVCLTNFPVQLIKEHVTADLHQNCYKKLLTSNSMTLSGQSVFCAACVAYMNIGDEITHLATTKHLSLTGDAIDRSIETVEDTAQTSPIYQRHFCEVCLVYLPGDPSNLVTHNNGARHKKNLTKSKSSKQMNEGNVVEKHTAVSKGVTNDGNLQPHDTVDSVIVPQFEYLQLIQATDNPTIGECKICVVLLSFSPERIREHLRSNSHQHKLGLLAENSIKLCGHLFWCGRCDVYVPLREQSNHIVDPDHVANMSVDEMDPSQANKLYRVAEFFCVHALQPTINRRTLRCHVCDVLIPDVGSALKTHFCGKKHRTHMAELFENNSVTEMNGSFNCRACRLRVRKMDVFYHIAEASHLAKLIQLETVSDKSLQDDKKSNVKVKSVSKGTEIDIKIASTNYTTQKKVDRNNPTTKSSDKNKETDVKSAQGGNGKGLNIKTEPNTKSEMQGDQKGKEGEVLVPILVQTEAGVKAENAAPTNNTDTGNDYYCNLCNVLTIVSDTDLARHNNGYRHKKISAVLSENKISLVNNTFYCELCITEFPRDTLHLHLMEKLDDDRSHCLVCNCIIGNNGLHALFSKDHLKLFNISLIADESSATKKEVHVTGPTTTEIVQLQAISTDTERRENDPFVEVQEAETSNSHHTEGDPVKVFCNVCFVSVDAKTYESHCELPKHKSNDALKAHHLLEYSPACNTLTCKVCLTCFNLDLMKEQVTADFHQNCFKTLLTSNSMILTGKSVFCKVCIAYINIDEVIAHVATTKHRYLTADAMSTPVESDEATAQTSPIYERYFCEVCSVYMPGDPNNLVTHNNGARHKKNLTRCATSKEVTEKETTLPKVAINGDISRSHETVDSMVVPQIEYAQIVQATDNDKVECKICLTMLSFTPSHVTEHCGSHLHQENLRLLNQNSVILCGSLFWCGRCDVHVPLRNQFIHIIDSEHLANMSVEETVPSQASNKLYRVAEFFGVHALLPTSDRRTLRCRVCDVIIPDSGSTLYMHFCGRKHRIHMAELLEKNCVVDMDGNFTCTVCRLRVRKEDLFYHIAKARHLTKIIKNYGIDFCKDTQKSNGQVKSVSQEEEIGTRIASSANTKQNKVDCGSDHTSKSLQKDKELDVKSAREGNSKEPNIKTDKEVLALNKHDQNAGAGIKVVNVTPKSNTDTGGNAYYCAVCDVRMTVSDANLAVHNNGSRHKSSFAVLVKNKISLVDNKCFCDICSTAFSRDALHLHLVQSNHIMMLNNM